MRYDIENTRNDFPILKKRVNDKKLVYLDSAASAQKPLSVINSMKRFQEEEYSNVHRGIHYLSNLATDQYEYSRRKVKNFINANSEDEIIFTMGATDAINLVAQSLSFDFFKKEDEIILTVMEHHSNIVPWHFLREKCGVNIKWINCDENGIVKVEDFVESISDKTKLISITQMSNVLGSEIPLKEIIKVAHDKNIRVLVDGCQGIAHLDTDVQDLNCDYYVFSGHKLYGPTGVGVLYGKYDHLETMHPWRGGGEMINEVFKDRVTYSKPPAKFEAGTPNIVQAVGLGAAIDYFIEKKKQGLFYYEEEIATYFHNEISKLPKVTVYGKENLKSPMVSFTVDGSHPHDIATIVDKEGVAIRAGQHCTQPLLDFFNLSSTARASIGMYTNKSDIDIFINSLNKAISFFD
ncbi:MAG: cysteine desulfurase [Rhodobiaceae bacterium]|nr:cysteine desulfurase [Rhodobiaceae bacterium]